MHVYKYLLFARRDIYHSAAHLRQQSVSSHWLRQWEESIFDHPTDLTSLNRSPKNCQVITSTTSTAMQNLDEIRSWKQIGSASTNHCGRSQILFT